MILIEKGCTVPAYLYGTTDVSLHLCMVMGFIIDGAPSLICLFSDIVNCAIYTDPQET